MLIQRMAAIAIAAVACAAGIDNAYSDGLRVAARVTRGGHGEALWHMPPHPELSRSEARSIARYILATRPAPRGRSTTGPAT